MIIHFLSSINFDNSKLAYLLLGFKVEPKETCLLKPSSSCSSICSSTSSEVPRDEQSALATASSSSSFPEKGPVMAKKSPQKVKLTQSLKIISF